MTAIAVGAARGWWSDMSGWGVGDNLYSTGTAPVSTRRPFTPAPSLPLPRTGIGNRGPLGAWSRIARVEASLPAYGTRTPPQLPGARPSASRTGYTSRLRGGPPSERWTLPGQGWPGARPGGGADARRSRGHRPESRPAATYERRPKREYPLYQVRRPGDAGQPEIRRVAHRGRPGGPTRWRGSALPGGICRGHEILGAAPNSARDGHPPRSGDPGRYDIPLHRADNLPPTSIRRGAHKLAAEDRARWAGASREHHARARRHSAPGRASPGIRRGKQPRSIPDRPPLNRWGRNQVSA